MARKDLTKRRFSDDKSLLPFITQLAPWLFIKFRATNVDCALVCLKSEKERDAPEDNFEPTLSAVLEFLHFRWREGSGGTLFTDLLYEDVQPDIHALERSSIKYAEALEDNKFPLLFKNAS